MVSQRQNREQHKRQSTTSASLLIAHPAFAPMLGVWGALLGGLAVLVLPPALLTGLTADTLFAAWPGLVQPLLAVCAAALMGGAILVIAAGLSRRARGASLFPAAAEPEPDDLYPIDPARDLGIGSLDDPVETMPFATAARRDTGAGVADASRPDGGEPRELDLAEFAELSGRSAVWVEEPAAPPAEENAPAPTPVARLHPASTAIDASAAALARLRAVPPSELSLAEMVERFAGAMHEHRHTSARKALTPQDLAAREAALAEALKALAALSPDGSAGAADDPLRAALTRLQGLRGAA